MSLAYQSCGVVPLLVQNGKCYVVHNPDELNTSVGECMMIPWPQGFLPVFPSLKGLEKLPSQVYSKNIVAMTSCPQAFTPKLFASGNVQKEVLRDSGLSVIHLLQIEYFLICLPYTH